MLPNFRTMILKLSCPSTNDILIARNKPRRELNGSVVDSKFIHHDYYCNTNKKIGTVVVVVVVVIEVVGERARQNVFFTS